MGRPGMMLHRKTRRLARDLDGFQVGFGPVLARGVLELLWDACYENGDPYLGDATDVEARAGWGGREGALVTALLEAGGPGHSGFIEEGGSPGWPEGEPGTYRVHDLFDHAPRYVKRRVHLEAARQADGRTISELRAEAGRKGGKQTASNRAASGQQTDGKLLLGSSNGAANGQQTVATPAPAPAPAHSRPEASPEPSASPPAPLKPKRAKKADTTDGSPVEPLRLELVRFIREQGDPYVEAIVEERTQLKRALKTPGVTPERVLAAFRALYARGGWRPRIQDVARALTAASERPGGRNGSAGRAAPASELRELKGIDEDGRPVYGGSLP